MRKLMAFSFVLASGLGYAETAETLMHGALANISRQGAVLFSMSGTESIDRNRTSFGVDIYVKLGTKTSWLEALVYRENKLVQRVVGDGENLWNYDLTRREFSCLAYAEDAGAVGAPMARQFATALTGNLAPASQMVYDVYVRAGANWRPPVGLSKVTVVDPTSSEPNYQIQAVSGTGKVGTQVQAYFDISHNDSGYALESFGATRRDTFGGQQRQVTWHTNVYWSNFDPKDANFQFVPPKGSRSVTVGPKVR